MKFTEEEIEEINRQLEEAKEEQMHNGNKMYTLEEALKKIKEEQRKVDKKIRENVRMQRMDKVCENETLYLLEDGQIKEFTKEEKEYIKKKINECKEIQKKQGNKNFFDSEFWKLFYNKIGIIDV